MRFIFTLLNFGFWSFLTCEVCVSVWACASMCVHPCRACVCEKYIHVKCHRCEFSVSSKGAVVLCSSVNIYLV